MRGTKHFRARARGLRDRATQPEQRLWRALKQLPVYGSHFRRQVAIGPYVIDFACLRAKLLIELDGSQHAEPERMRRDAARTCWLENEGYRVLRFWNGDLISNLNDVLVSINLAAASSLEGTASTPPRHAARADPPPQGEGGR